MNSKTLNFNKKEETNELTLATQKYFGNVQCDFWKNENGEVFMSINQLAQALEYSDRRGVDNIVARHDYLSNPEFSTVHTLNTLEGERIVRREMRLFSEVGIFEITMLSKQPKTKEFRAWARGIIKSVKQKDEVNKLTLAVQNNFGDVQCDFWKNENGDVFMSINQLAQALEYTSKNGIEKIIERNNYLTAPELSTTAKLSVVEGNRTVHREMRIFTEEGIYEITMLSKQPKAREFRSWARKILKSVRKHGFYAIDELLDNPDFLIRVVGELKAERDQRIALEAKVADDEPKVLFADAVSSSVTSIPVGDLAKLLKQNGIDIGRTRLFAWLRETGYLMKSGESKNLPTQQYMNNEYFEIKENTYRNWLGYYEVSRTTMVTGKGQLHFINLFIKNNIAGDYNSI